MSENGSYDMDLRRAELAEQHWNREQARRLAASEGLQFTDDHWDVALFLRKRYLEKGLPPHARILARELEDKYASRGGKKYLYRLFSGGPVTQGSRLASLVPPAGATDASFGTRY